MNILSILWSTCSTAALMRDGKIVACVSEERFSRKKNDESYPKAAIEAVLKICSIDANDLDHVVIAGERFDPTGILTHKWSTFSARDRLREQTEYWYPRLYQGKAKSYLDIFKSKMDINQYPGNWDKVLRFLRQGKPERTNQFFQAFRRDTVASHLGIDSEKITFAHHHRSHGLYSYYASPINKDKVVILTADAWGDDMNASVSLAEGGKIKLLHTSDNFIIGRLYRYITLLLGMKPDEHEYKVMGLAAYAKPGYYQQPLSVFSNTMYVKGLGFAYKQKPKDLYFYFRDKLEGYRFDSIAGAIQQYTQDTLLQWAANALKTTGAHKICFGGGVAMNIKAVMEIAGLPQLEDIFICPVPSDESLAIGAAYLVMHDKCLREGVNPLLHLKPLENAYLGPEDSIEKIKSTVEIAKKKGYRIRKNPGLNYIAKFLASGKVIGRCCGKSEFGARALGNRSILADPRNPEVIKLINEQVKSRDFWMPFAPTILAERADDYLVNPKGLKAPYMTIAFATTKKAHRDLKAAIHQYDLTARPQVLTSYENQSYHDLISEFNKLTGVGGLLNTSFNMHGEPIVQTGEDAMSVFERGALDALLLDGYFVERK